MKFNQPEESAPELYEHGLRHELGNECPLDLKKAFEYYLEAARKGHALSCWRQGFFLEWGRGVKRDLNKATECYRLSAEGGCAYAQLRYAQILFNNKNTIQEAVSWLEKASSNGLPDALYLLGCCQEKGV
ncbi:MAG: sel1 repeat family protein, partial [Victivallales bacterium]|nr:sel1 repeat family protein [Victivallales bacterium]